MKLKSRRDVVNETSSPNLSQKCSYKYLHWLVVHFAISIVQFNIILFQFKDANHHCLWRKPWRPIQMIQKWSKRTHNCSEFCQDPPESSGRWECPDIRWSSVHVNPRCLHTTADPPPCVTLAAYPTRLFSSASAVTQTKPMVTAAPSPIFTRKNPRRRIEGAGELIVNLSNYLLFQLVSAFNKTACYSMMFFLVLVTHWPYLNMSWYTPERTREL